MRKRRRKTSRKPDPNLVNLSVEAAKVILSDNDKEFAFYLDTKNGRGPVLYSDARTTITEADVDRLDEHGVHDLFVSFDNLENFENVVEQHLEEVLSHKLISSGEKSKLVYQVGTSMAREFVDTGTNAAGLERSKSLIDNVIGSVLTDPAIGANMLRMAGHERSTASHMFVVSTLSVILGAEVFGAEHEMLRALGMAGMMHDLGKLGISKDILNKNGPLTQQELSLVHQHPIESVRLLGDDPHVTPAVRQMILQHHERPDGRGYPLGSRGDEIFPGSRILTIIDCFHAMIGRRPYRDPMMPDQALRNMNAQAGKQFDPELLRVWNGIVDRHASQIENFWQTEISNLQEELPTRHEHRAVDPSPISFGARPKRFTCEKTVQVRCKYAGRLVDATCAPDVFDASMYDISRGGMCLHSSYPMYRGEVVHVQVSLDDEPKWVRGLVAWCRQASETMYKVGVRFTKRISGREVYTEVEIDPLVSDARVPLAQPSIYSKRGAEEPSGSKDEQITQLQKILRVPRPSIKEEKPALKLARSQHVEVRRRAVEVLLKIGTRPARAEICQLITDEDTRVQEAAIGAAGTLKMVEAQYGLRQVLKGDNPGLAIRAAGALGAVGDDVGLARVLEVLQQDGEHAPLAARALGQITGERFAANARGVEDARRFLTARPDIVRRSTRFQTA